VSTLPLILTMTLSNNTLSVVIITQNEEHFIGKAIKSASFADEVLVLDSGSTDRTIEIAKGMGARVEHRNWLGFGRQKNAAIDLAHNNWVFVLDSDEQITGELADELKKTLDNPPHDGFFVARLNKFFGKNIKTCGLYPDYSVRLFDKTKARFNDVEVHESVQLKSQAGYLSCHMLHNAYKDIDEFIAKQNRYSSLHSSKKNLLKALLNPYWTFFNLYIVKKGFLDGWHGFVIAKLYAQYTFWKYIK